MADTIQQHWPSNLPWNVKLFIHALSFAVDVCRRPDGSVNRLLLRFFDRQSSASPNPINGVKSSDVSVDQSRNLYFRLFTPQPHSGRLPVIFFFHGGGFALLSPSSKPYHDFCCRLASQLSAIVVSVNYRLSPEHRYPAQIIDCFDVLKFIDTAEIDGLSGIADLNQCFLAGDSAGGNLVHHVALKAGGHEFGKVKLIGNISIQPFFGGEERTESERSLTGAPFVTLERSDWMWKAVLPEGSNRDHPAANVFGPGAGEMRGVRYPATIVFVGRLDPLKDWQKRYYEGLRKQGKEAFLVEYENGFHTFYVYPEIAESALFIKEVKDFMRNQSVSHSTTL